MNSTSRDNICFLFAGFCLLLGPVYYTRAQTIEDIAKIRSEVATINKGVSKYQKTKKDVEAISLEGTEATYYRSAGDLRKITAKIYGESYNATGEFYYREGELIFAFLKQNKYDTQIGSARAPKVVRVEERRFYFARGQPIKLLVGKRELRPGEERHTELVDEIVSISTKLKDYRE